MAKRLRIGSNSRAYIPMARGLQRWYNAGRSFTMSDRMQLLPFRQLMETILEEYRASASVFGLHESLWYRKSDNRRVEIMGQQCGLPLGPAAGPHTQLAQNIISAYLSGSRFFELKTVQILDSLEIEKPCIDAADEAYNTEWSTELSLDAAWQEYARAWIALHVIEELWDLGGPGGVTAAGHGRGHGTGRSENGAARSFIFNMSVGYDLEGIRQPRMQDYIARMTDPCREPQFLRWLDEIEALPADPAAGGGLEPLAGVMASVRARAAAPICSSVTLSTMHGCPPQEIEAICRYMLIDKQLDTYVKLNPTLLGYATVRSILDGLGYDYVQLDRTGFEHDLQYRDAVEILTRLRATAATAGRRFGIKLTNTLAVNNTGDVLPGDQMYLSGRALYPLSINLAAQLSREFNGDLPISYCGGITVHNAAAVLRTGIRPLTLCTVLLKPGGYGRQVQIARELEAVEEWNPARIDVAALTQLADQVRSDRTAHKSFRGNDEVRIQGKLPVYDCYQAPCVTACPIGQHVPEYIRLVGEERYAEALELIYERNALPAITGHICDHQCQYACTRLDYEGCLNIRELKKIAVEHGSDEHRAAWRAPAVTRGSRCAVIGAGPAGLAAAYFLAREGFAVTVFERERNAGGVVRNVIPQFRLPVEAIERDIEFVTAHGVDFVFGADPRLNAAGLRAQGFGPIFVAIGAEKATEIELAGDRSRVVRSLDFLWGFRGNRTLSDIGPRVVVVGGGNTAMDAARAALTLPGVQHVDVLYRRSRAEMPADREEYENALADGVTFHFLRTPEELAADGALRVRVMKLGEPDASGRRRPLPTERVETARADTLITAIGERVDNDMLRAFGIPLDEAGRPITDPLTLETQLADVYLGGDARSGPSTVVQCIAAGRRAADAIIHRHDAGWERHEKLPCFDRARRLEQVGRRKVTIAAQPDPRRYRDAREFAAIEYDRCLECSYVCNKCVEVCPNRANISVATIDDDLFDDPFQIVHLDAYCNECGNCGHFCPWSDNVPYRDKPTVFSSREEFDGSSNDGWLLEGRSVRTRFGGVITLLQLHDGRLQHGLTAGNGDGVNTAVAGSPDGVRFRRLFELLYRRRPQLFSAMEAMQ
ncbi:MAG: putative selenate reductase subunit YgfK [Spirochaetaceae bacterium]|nr:MAG: putative selenate reductase subunit YgfK [Spirochaetaceae bacterium]